MISSAWLSVFAKINVFGTSFLRGKSVVNRFSLKRANDRAYLTWIDNIPVKLCGFVIHIFIKLFPAFGSGQAVTVFNELFHQMCAVFSHLCFNQKYIFAPLTPSIMALFTRILADNIFH